jgi:hypothetical protein
MVMIAVMCIAKKDQAPESLPRPNPIGVGYIRPPPFKFHIVTAVAAVKRTSGERSAAVTQQLFLTSGCREPRVESLFRKYGLRKRTGVS